MPIALIAAAHASGSAMALALTQRQKHTHRPFDGERSLHARRRHKARRG
jgi:hypothetical protein